MSDIVEIAIKDIRETSCLTDSVKLIERYIDYLEQTVISDMTVGDEEALKIIRQSFIRGLS